MADRSKIEWTDATWNPIRARDPQTGRVGWHCVKISPACTNCYAAAQNQQGLRGGTKQPYADNSTAEVFLDEQVLQKPRHWKRPRRIFVCSMTDLFGDWVTVEMLDRIYDEMAFSPQHTFQVLTKRPERMHRYHENLAKRVAQIPNNPVTWPLPNVWLGVTAEDQLSAEERIPWLLYTPAARRIVSCEPLLGEVRLRHLLHEDEGQCVEINALTGEWSYVPSGVEFTAAPAASIDQVIAGGESGRGRGIRPSNPYWFRLLRDQCQADGVSFFFKQHGEFQAEMVPGTSPELADLAANQCVGWGDGKTNHVRYTRVGKKKAGRLLDGREWNEFPSPVVEAI